MPFGVEILRAINQNGENVEKVPVTCLALGAYLTLHF